MGRSHCEGGGGGRRGRRGEKGKEGERGGLDLTVRGKDEGDEGKECTF